MTDRVNALTVALEQDIRADDVQVISQAINQFRGVLSVGSNISNPDSWMAEERAKQDMLNRVMAAIREK